MATKKKIGKIEEKKVSRSQTFRDLAALLERDDYAPGDDGGWPEVLLYKYERVGSADVQAWRIRQGQITLPDHEGGDRGVWAAHVTNDVQGDSERQGPGKLYVRYLGVMVGE